MKRILLAALLCSGLIAKGQDLAYKIPKEAMAVAAIKGDKFMELATIADFNSSILGKKLLGELAKKRQDGHYNSVEDIGLQLNGTAYYYNLQTDSISYNCLLFSLADVARFEQLLSGRAKKIERKGATRSLYSAGDKTLLLWDDKTALIAIGSLKVAYFEADSLRGARYGIKRVNYGDYYRDNYDAPAVVDYAAADTPVTIADTATWAEAANAAEAAANVAVAAEEETRDTERNPEPVIDTAVSIMIAPPEPVPDVTIIEAPPVVAEVADPSSYYDQTTYNQDYEAQKKIQDGLTKEWLTRYAANAFEKTTGPSILDNPDFLRSQDKNAAASFYLAGMEHLYSSFMTPFYPGYRYSGLGNLMRGYESINARLYLEKEKAFINTEMQLDDQKAASYKKIYGHKPNKQFARYINSDKLVGFISYSFDTEHYLKELPEMMKPVFSQYFGVKYGEETSIGADLLSLLLDEKAISKVVKGDAVLLFTDIGPKEYTYTTYEYNDDYERKEVTKTKTETVPDFLFMMSSDDPHIFQRLLDYGVHKEKIVLKNGIYSLDSKLTGNAPFRLHVLIKDGIVFCGTAYRDIQQIAAGTYQGNMAKDQKDLLLKNNMALYFNPKNVIGKLPRDEFGSYRNLEALNTLLGNTGPMYARTTGIKGNRISGELVAQVPGNKNNALQYFLSLIEYAAKLD
ncbi:hypothetical protein [Taibaiella koreensis]|uniref:hypothetical protein n=1 Tax=Taibaiella koreensis TaxID=1268548 RepID=UPI000E59E11C|nr:hypothetical protein [Taibaiella koreensis]